MKAINRITVLQIFTQLSVNTLSTTNFVYQLKSFNFNYKLIVTYNHIKIMSQAYNIVYVYNLWMNKKLIL